MSDPKVVLWILCALVALLVVAFSVYSYVRWTERDEIRLEREEIKSERTEVHTLLTEVRTLLGIIKGWSLIVSSSSAQATTEVKEEIKGVPELTAQKVMEIISGGDSGKLKVVSDEVISKEPEPDGGS